MSETAAVRPWRCGSGRGCRTPATRAASGLDTTDFHFGSASARPCSPFGVVGNFGFGILADPVRGDSQNDVLDYGVSVARAVKHGVELVGELNGRQHALRHAAGGTESRRRCGSARASRTGRSASMAR